MTLRRSPRAREAFSSPVGNAVLRVFKVRTASAGTKELFSELSKTSAEMDRIIAEIREFTESRQAAVIKLESDLGRLAQQEQEMREKIAGLEKVPLPVAEYFADLVDSGEKKSAARDYILFLLGVISSAVVAIVLKKFGY